MCSQGITPARPYDTDLPLRVCRIQTHETSVLLPRHTMTSLETGWRIRECGSHMSPFIPGIPHLGLYAYLFSTQAYLVWPDGIRTYHAIQCADVSAHQTLSRSFAYLSEIRAHARKKAPNHLSVAEGPLPYVVAWSRTLERDVCIRRATWVRGLLRPLRRPWWSVMGADATWDYLGGGCRLRTYLTRPRGRRGRFPHPRPRCPPCRWWWERRCRHPPPSHVGAGEPTSAPKVRRRGCGVRE